MTTKKLKLEDQIEIIVFGYFHLSISSNTKTFPLYDIRSKYDDFGIK